MEILTGLLLPNLHNAAGQTLHQPLLRLDPTAMMPVLLAKDHECLSFYGVRAIIIRRERATATDGGFPTMVMLPAPAGRSKYKKHGVRQRQKLCTGSPAVFFSQFFCRTLRAFGSTRCCHFLLCVSRLRLLRSLANASSSSSLPMIRGLQTGTSGT